MKTINWFVCDGEILDADYSNATQPDPVEFEYMTEQDPEWVPEDKLKKYPVPVKDIDPDKIITYTGEVLYIGQEDIMLDSQVLRQIKFIVREHITGLVWSLFPGQVKYKG